MIRVLLATGLLAMAGCKNGHAEAPGAAPGGAKGPETHAPAPAAGGSPTVGDPATLYAECRDRLESPESPNECAADADCASAGCGKEVCTTSKAAAELVSTCEDKPCFHVVEACGCRAGACTWNVKAAMPAPAPLPRSIPSNGPSPVGSPAPAPAPAP